MQVSIIETSGLGDRSYLVDDGGGAVVIDPQRDIDRVLALAADRDVRITHVLETHIHNDYVTGGLQLARAAGAEYIVPAGEDVEFDCRAVDDGDRVRAGALTIEVLLTPGHTHRHVSYVLRDPADRPVAVFTGGSMLHGSTGRTDLLGEEHTEELTHAQYHSVRRLAAALPDDTVVYPTHGFGSFCSATPGSGEASTISEQRSSNPALTKDEDAYVAELLAGLSEFPAYYAHMGVLNRKGPRAVELTRPEPVDPAELRRRIDAGEWVIDLRHRTAFAAGHLGGSYGFELSGSFVSYVGWLVEWGAALTLIGVDEDQIADARRELVRIGVDEIAGAATGDIEQLAAGGEVRAYPVSDFAALASRLMDVVVLDVRQRHEHDAAHVNGAVNVALHELDDAIDRLPSGEIWVHCASGYRASIAASLLDRTGRQVVLIDDDFDAATSAGITSDRDEPPRRKDDDSA